MKLGLVTTFFFIAFISMTAPSFAQSGDVIIVDDPATKNAIIEFNNKMKDVGKSCAPTAKGGDMNEFMVKVNKCVCNHLSEISPLLETKIKAFSELLKRKPELANQMIKIKGQFGNIVIRPEDLKKNAINSLNKQYNCQMDK
ncbi:MAG TPA: hypothetical protein DD400_04020 [Rhodospirillaceae bacterium]|nr:hypothetical protein [Rhodospirillaceae bacterium]